TGALKRRIEQGQGDRQSLYELHSRMQKLTTRSSAGELVVEFIEADLEFHATIARLAGVQAAVPLLRQLHSRIWIASPAIREPRRMRDILVEHRRILKALEFGTERHLKKAIFQNIHGFARIWRPYEF